VDPKPAELVGLAVELEEAIHPGHPPLRLKHISPSCKMGYFALRHPTKTEGQTSLSNVAQRDKSRRNGAPCQGAPLLSTNGGGRKMRLARKRRRAFIKEPP
jgi:hypothetical protein